MPDYSSYGTYTPPPAPGGAAPVDYSSYGTYTPPPSQGDDFISHAGTSTWDNVKGALNLATGADLWSHAIDSAKAGNYGEAAKAFQGIVDGPAQRVADGLIDTAKVAVGHMKDAASKLIQGDAAGAADSATAAGLHAATILAPHAEQAAENFKQGRYGAGAGDLTGDALAYLAAKGIHAVPEDFAGRAATTVKEGVKAAAPDVARGAGKVAVGAALDAAGVPYHLATVVGAERGMPQIVRGVVKGARAAHEAWAAGPAPTEAEAPATPPPLPPQPVTPAIDPNAPPEGVPQAWWDRLGPDHRQALRDKLAGTPAPAAAASAAPAAPAAAPRTVSYDESRDPAVAKQLGVGDVRTMRDGSTQTLHSVPIGDIRPDPAGENVIYPDTVALYQQGIHPLQGVQPMLRNDNTTFEGHHRIEADKQNGATAVTAWKPDAPAEPAAPSTALPAVDPGIAQRRMPGMNYQDVDAYLASKRPPPPPPGEPGEAAAPAATQPPPASPAAPAAAAPQVQTIPFASDALPPKDFAAAARAPRVQKFADYLEANKVPIDSLKQLPKDSPFWKTLGDAVGIKSPSAATVSDLLDELDRRTAARTPKAAPTMMTPSERYLEILQGNPAALEHARNIADLMR